MLPSGLVSLSIGTIKVELASMPRVWHLLRDLVSEELGELELGDDNLEEKISLNNLDGIELLGNATTRLRFAPKIEDLTPNVWDALIHGFPFLREAYLEMPLLCKMDLSLFTQIHYLDLHVGRELFEEALIRVRLDELSITMRDGALPLLSYLSFRTGESDEEFLEKMIRIVGLFEVCADLVEIWIETV